MGVEEDNYHCDVVHDLLFVLPARVRLSNQFVGSGLRLVLDIEG